VAGEEQPPDPQIPRIAQMNDRAEEYVARMRARHTPLSGPNRPLMVLTSPIPQVCHPPPDGSWQETRVPPDLSTAPGYLGAS